MINVVYKKNGPPTKMADLPDGQSMAFATKMNKTPMLYVPYRKSDNRIVFAVIMVKPEGLCFTTCEEREFSTMKALKERYPNEELVDVTIEI